jgi:hypothetical protein
MTVQLSRSRRPADTEDLTTTSLNFSNDYSMSSPWFIYRMKEKSFLRLDSLSLARTKVDDACIPVIQKCCPNITNLDLSYTLVSDAGVNPGTPFWNLPNLNLSGCYNITPLPKNEIREGLKMDNAGCTIKCDALGKPDVTYDDDFDREATVQYRTIAIFKLYSSGMAPAVPIEGLRVSYLLYTIEEKSTKYYDPELVCLVERGNMTPGPKRLELENDPDESQTSASLKKMKTEETKKG